MTHEEKIKEVVKLMTLGIKAEAIASHPETLHRIQELYNDNPDGFLKVLQFAQSEFGILLEEVLAFPDSDKVRILPHILNGLFKHFHERRIEKLEGFSCCADKSSFIVGKTLRAIRFQENLSLYDDYMNVEQIKEDKEEQAYWSPKTVKDTDEAIELFWDWYLQRD